MVEYNEINQAKIKIFHPTKLHDDMKIRKETKNEEPANSVP